MSPWAALPRSKKRKSPAAPGQRGVTFVELLICIAVLSIIAGIDVALLKGGLDAWVIGASRVSLQRVSDDVMEILLEGGYEEDGIRDGVEMREASLDVIGFIPLWTDRSHTPSATSNREQKFILERQFKPGGTTPVGQVKEPDSENFAVVPVRFDYGSSRDPDKRDDVVQFLEPIPSMSEIRILYTPDGDSDPEVIKFFRWDPQTKHVYSSYGGVTKDLLRFYDNVTVERCAFLYYDNLNRLITMDAGESLSSLSLKRATGVKIYLLLRRGEERKELTSFTSVRNISTIGATITEGAELPISTPDKIKAFSLGDFYGFKRSGIVELVVKTAQHKGLKIWLKFKEAPKEEDLILERFRMESPPGKILASAILEQTIAKNEFVSLLTLDRTGLYDYDDDEDMKDMVVVTGENPTVTVTRLDFEGASLFTRP